MSQSSFIVLEGADGSGKSSLAKRLQSEYFNNRACDVFFEPTDKTDAGREIRRVLKSGVEVTPAISRNLKELLYIDRLWDVKNRIKPALLRGHHVVLDRYYFSTAAYQAATPDEAISIVQEYHSDELMLKPDIVFFLDLEPKTALERILKRDVLRDIYESKVQVERTILNYRSLFSRFNENLVIIDGNRGIDMVFSDVTKELIKRRIQPK